MTNDQNMHDGERGQGLPYVIVMSAVLLIFLIALVDLVVREMGAGVMTSKKNLLLHAADAGVDRAITALQVANNWKEIPAGLVGGYNADMIFSEVPGVIYRLKIQEGNWTPGFQIGDKDAERTITVFASQPATGDRKKIQAVVMQSTIGSALFSQGQILISGSADIQWGPVVSYSTASNAIPSPMNHPVYMSAGGIGGTLPDCEDPIAGELPGGCVKENATDLGTAPVFPLDEMRSIAKGQSTYQGGTGACYTVNDTLLGKKDDDTVVFWDTCDGKNFNPITDSKCSGCTATAHGVDVKLTGSWGGKGTLVVMGDLDTKGTDNQPVSMVPPPDCMTKYGNAASCNNGNPKAATVMWDGLIYVAGSLSSSGNKMIYGSLYAYDTAGVGGNFSLYYKTNNKGNAFLGKTVLTKLWLEKAPTATEYASGLYNPEL
jgi:hypothetical protein